MSTLEPGRPVELVAGITRLLAPNAGLMTGPGTNTYLVGTREVAVIDPGPALDAHLDAIVAAARGPIRWILVTHTHPDHSPGAAALAAATGAALLGRPAPAGRHQDTSFRPDRVLEDGDRLTAADFTLTAVHTPGHASNHLCYLHEATRWLFTGDHIIAGSTVVIDPPDGNMAAYLRSLERLAELAPAALVPGHGDVVGDPVTAIRRLVEHRLRREDKVARTLGAHPGSTLQALVRHAYDDVPASLHRIAERSLLAHLEKLEAEGRARRAGDAWHPA